MAAVRKACANEVEMGRSTRSSHLRSIAIIELFSSIYRRTPRLEPSRPHDRRRTCERRRVGEARPSYDDLSWVVDQGRLW